MVFSAPIFLFYFLPIFLLIYYFLPQKYKNSFLLIASILFYAWGAPKFIPFILGSILIDFFIVRKLDKSPDAQRKPLLILSLLLNVGLLAWFKYANFFAENILSIFQWMNWHSFTWNNILLPIGISFFTFQKISYSVDVYRKKSQPFDSIANYALYILMFPQLIAGPIIRYNEIKDQIIDRSQNSGFDDLLIGFIRFMVGLAKKVLIANVLAEQVDAIFAVSPDYFSSGTAWIGMLAFTFQIYFDFSGYSDMALGLGKMMGFNFPENFNFPYISQSITEFWKRWHITLGKWMQDYLYIPLGGNRVPIKRMYLNLIIVFLISGLWHGAAWTFVFWGAYHGLFLILDKLFLLKFNQKIGRIPSIIITFFIAMFGWVIFRADSISYAIDYLQKLFLFDFRIDEFHFDARFITIFIMAFLFSFFGINKKMENLPLHIFNAKVNSRTLILLFSCSIVLYLLCGGALLSGGFNPFIYFRF